MVDVIKSHLGTSAMYRRVRIKCPPPSSRESYCTGSKIVSCPDHKSSNRGGSGIKEVVRLTIVAHCGRRCPEGGLLVGRGAKRRSVRAKRGKIFSHVFLAMRKRSRSIKMAVLGKKRPWLLWSFNDRPTTRTRNSRVCI